MVMLGESYEFCYVGADVRLGVLLKFRLGQVGINALTASDTINACRLVKQFLPRVVLVDERLDNRVSLIDDTIAHVLASDIRKFISREDLALIWHPERATRERVVGAFHSGFDAILVRPLTFSNLVDRINSYLKPAKRVSIEKMATLPEREQSADGMRARLDLIQSLSAVPFVVERVLKITSSDESGARDLAQVIESDPQVAAIVLMRSNSAFYAATRKIGRIIDAVSRIGFREVRSIVLGLSVINMFSKEQKTIGFDRVEFWKKSLLTAVIARKLAAGSAAISGDDAFIAGLIADIGRMVLDEHFTEDFTRALNVAERYRISLSEAEEKIFGMDHQEIGREILERWRFPEQLIAVVGCHEAPMKIRAIKDEQQRALAEIVWAAQWVSGLLPMGSSGDSLVEYPDPEFANGLWFWNELTPDFTESAYEEVRDLLCFVGATLDAPPSSPVPQNGSRGIAIYEASNLPISPMEYLLTGANFSVVRSSDIVRFESEAGDRVAVVEFNTLDAFREALPYVQSDDRRIVVILPRGEFPKDDTVKKRVGLPIERTAYLEKPIHKDVLWQEICRIMSDLDQPA